MTKQNVRRAGGRFAVIAGALLAIALLWPATAAAKNPKPLTKYLPSQSEMVLGSNVESLRQSKYFTQLIGWGRSQLPPDNLLTVLERDAGIKPSDLDAMVVGIDKPQPSSKNIVYVVEADFERKKVLEVLQKKLGDLEATKVGKLDIYQTSGVSFAFPEEGLVVMAAGDKAYRGQAMQVVAGKASGLAGKSEQMKLLGKINPAKDFWMTALTANVQAPGAASGPKPESMAMSAGLASGLDFKMVANMASKADAQSTMAQLTGLKQQGKNPMMGMLGLQPFIDNLKSSQSGKQVVMESTMTAAELDQMIARLTQMAKSQGMGGMPGGAPGGMTAPPAQKPGQKKGGANADFN